MPKVSIVIPVYNVEKVLPKCIESVLNQTFTDFEFILVNDGSLDKSGEICDAYAQKDRRILVIHKENAGVSGARNTGLEAATGEYLMFVDSDDYIDENMLEEMLVCEGSDIILSGIRYVDKYGNFIKEHFAEAFVDMPLDEYVDTQYVFDENMRYVLGGPCNKLFARKILAENNIRFHEELSICEDGLFVVQCLAKCNCISSVAKAFYNYVQYGTDTLMCRYNDNGIYACELYYKAICDLLSCGKNMTDKMRRSVDEDRLRHFSALFFQIYSRSGLSGKEKYKKTKEAFQNATFVRLAKKTEKKSFKAYIIKFTAITGCILPIHVICSLWFRRK